MDFAPQMFGFTLDKSKSKELSSFMVSKYLLLQVGFRVYVDYLLYVLYFIYMFIALCL